MLKTNPNKNGFLPFSGGISDQPPSLHLASAKKYHDIAIIVSLSHKIQDFLLSRHSAVVLVSMYVHLQ